MAIFLRAESATLAKVLSSLRDSLQADAVIMEFE